MRAQAQALLIDAAVSIALRDAERQLGALRTVRNAVIDDPKLPRQIFCEFVEGPFPHMAQIAWRAAKVRAARGVNQIAVRRGNDRVLRRDALDEMHDLVRVGNMLDYVRADDQVCWRYVGRLQVSYLPGVVRIVCSQEGDGRLQIKAGTIKIAKILDELESRAATNVIDR